MIIRKSVNVLLRSATDDYRLKEYKPVILSDVKEIEKVERGKNKGLLKLVLSAIYFLSLVAGLTILLT
jgi:hypothetical protein